MILRSALFNIAFWFFTFLIGTLGLPFSILYRPWALHVARLWAVMTLGCLRVLCNIRYEVRGHEHIPDGTALIASKHQSAWDTVVFWLILRKPVFVLKRELIYIPVFGWQLLLLKSISIDRKAGASAMKRMLREASARAGDNNTIIIFPEGTRSAPGATSVYHPGVAALYQNLKLPVVPVALNSGLHWSKNAFIKKPGVITIEFLPPIPPGMKGRDFLPLLQTRIEEASRALIAADAT